MSTDVSPTCIQEREKLNNIDENAEGTNSGEANLDTGDNTKKIPVINKDVIIQIIMEFLGAFLGVLAAITADKCLEKKQYKEINDSLYDELQKIYADREKNKDADFYRYPTQIWDIYMASGQLSFLVSGHIDKEYIEIYSKIQYAQSLEQEYIHSKIAPSQTGNTFLQDYIKITDSARKRESDEIKKMIKALPEKVTKCQAKK